MLKKQRKVRKIQIDFKLQELTQQEIELALRVLDRAVQAVQAEEVKPIVVPESLQHLTTAEWDQLCLVMESLVIEQRQSVLH